MSESILSDSAATVQHHFMVALDMVSTPGSETDESHIFARRSINFERKTGVFCDPP